MNWNDIRPLENSQREGFEELVCQLARNEKIANVKTYIRKGKPDAGVECFWILENEDEIAWQAKFFTSSLSATQWGEIDESVKTVLGKHPKLKTYVVAIPIDPPDARISEQTSLLEKWDSHVLKWKQWANDKGLEVEFRPWWNSDLVERLRLPENVGLIYYFFHKEEFTNEWCFEQTESSITDLGKRYTPEINVELEISKIFDSIVRNPYFIQRKNNIFDNFFLKGRKFISDYSTETHSITEVQERLDEVFRLFTDTSFSGINHIPYGEFSSLVSTINEHLVKTNQYWSEKRRAVEGDPERSRERYNSQIGHLREFEEAIYELEDFIQSIHAHLSNYPVLVVDGQAGIGKSHLIADVVKNRNAMGYSSVFLLGQHFVTDEDPWTQIFKKLKIKCSVAEFLGSLNAKAETAGSRLIIFIDAINEGRGKYFWDKNIKSFIKEILKYEWLGVVFTIRDSYKDLIFTEDNISEGDILEHTHYGFRDAEYEASKIFFANYGIELPSVPLLHPEFQNPLFLKLFCEGLNKAGYSKIPGGMQGITAIIDFFIDSINDRLSKPDRLNFPKNINVVKKAVDALISEKNAKNLRYIPYEEGFILADKILSQFSTQKGFLDELISEGILSKNLFWKESGDSEEGVYLAYERFEDHLTAAYLISESSNLENDFGKGGSLYYLAEDEHNAYINKGLIEALTIQLPEKTSKEFYEYAPHAKNFYPVVESYVQSLLWRKTDTIGEKSKEYVNESVFLYEGTHDLFWETIIAITAVPNHFFNAYLLHNHLINFTMADRDAKWTQFLKYRLEDESAVKRLIAWAWDESDKSHISDESIELSAITIGWFHASSNRKLRDYATKGLISLLENRIQVLIELLKIFESVNDPSIYERLFAVAYGCSLRTVQKEQLTELSEYIYKIIFQDKNEIYPHILLRDYAREIIEYTASLGYKLSFDIEQCRPPYKSSFPDKFLTNEELDTKYEFNYQSKNFKDYYWAQNNILSSMTTEYGRGTARYGDFGRYTFQSAFYGWDVNVDELSNIAVEWIFEKYGFDVEKHGEFDRSIGSGRGRSDAHQERIGKKYQWIALYEMLARVSDNFDKYERWSLGEKTKEPCEGPWSPYVRDIDPTMTISKTRGRSDEDPNIHWSEKEFQINSELTNSEWVHSIDDLPNLQQSIEVVDDNGDEWLILEGYPSWMEAKKIGDEKWQKPYKRFWYHIRSYLVKSEEYETLKEALSSKMSVISQLPKSYSRYEIFSREYYWSPVHKYFFSEEHKDNYWQKIEDSEDVNIRDISVIVTSESFLWEETADYSKEEAISFLKPSTHIFKKMLLQYGKREGDFINDSNEVICFDPSVHNNAKSHLLLKKAPFLKYLEENDLKILWTIIGEKNIIGEFYNDGDYPGRLEIGGVFYLEDGIINGTVDSKKT